MHYWTRNKLVGDQQMSVLAPDAFPLETAIATALSLQLLTPQFIKGRTSVWRLPRSVNGILPGPLNVPPCL